MCPFRLTGTLRYMAPEVYRSDKVYTEKVDIYSAGLLFYCFATGQRPFSSVVSLWLYFLFIFLTMGHLHCPV